MKGWYRQIIGKYIFRKLNLRIALILIIIFIILGMATRITLYNLLEKREQLLLDIRTEKFSQYLLQVLENFKKETTTLYTNNISVDNQLIPGYRFLEQVSQDDLSQHLQSTYFRNLLRFKIDSTPEALAMLIYRNKDRQLYHVPKLAQYQLKANFDFHRFFASLPKDYNFPYLGTIDSYLTNYSHPIPYVVVPIFDYNEITNDNALGYYMMSLDPQILLQQFDSLSYQDNYLTIQYGDQTLLNNLPNQQLNSNNYLSSMQNLKRYSLKIIGSRDKRIIQSQANPILLIIYLTLTMALLVCILLISQIQKHVVNRIYLMVNHFKKVQEDPFARSMKVLGEDEISYLMEQFNHMTDELKEHIRKIYIAELQRRNAEFYALKMQINPHFLYNTLESLRMQSLINDQPNIAESLYQLGELLHWLLKQDSDTVSIKEELRYSENYLSLFTMGKSNPVELQVLSEIDLNHCSMLKFSLQPIIENVIIHGNLDQVVEPLISIRITLVNSNIMIEIRNNGQGLTAEEQEKLQHKLEQSDPFGEQHLGLKNVHERIRTFYGESYGLHILPLLQEEGFGLTIQIPYIHPMINTDT